jgi:uncharacterized Zn ribbon protein
MAIRLECPHCEHEFAEDGHMQRMTYSGHNVHGGGPYDLGGMLAEPPEYQPTCPNCDEDIYLEDCEIEICDECLEKVCMCDEDEEEDTSGVSPESI